MDSVNEWSHEFDLAYDNITSGRAPGLVPYEKSVFLTEGQENVVIGLYKGVFGDSFEATEEVTSYLSTIVKQCNGTIVGSSDINYNALSDKSKVYKLNNTDVLFITLEECEINTAYGKKMVPVIPVTQDEYWRTVRNPFKRSNSNRVLRLAYGISHGSGTSLTEARYSELFSTCDISKYIVRYISRPEPIILTTLTNGLSINGSTTVNTCKLPKAIHRLILSEAVRLAKAKWNS